MSPSMQQNDDPEELKYQEPLHDDPEENKRLIRTYRKRYREQQRRAEINFHVLIIFSHSRLICIVSLVYRKNNSRPSPKPHSIFAICFNYNIFL